MVPPNAGRHTVRLAQATAGLTDGQLNNFRMTPAQNTIRLAIRAMFVHLGRPRTRRRGSAVFEGVPLSMSEASPILYIAASRDTPTNATGVGLFRRRHRRKETARANASLNMAMLAQISSPQFAVTRLTGRKTQTGAGRGRYAKPSPTLACRPSGDAGGSSCKGLRRRAARGSLAAQRDDQSRCARSTRARDFSRPAPWR
jgi:hypothetical protein